MIVYMIAGLSSPDGILVNIGRESHILLSYIQFFVSIQCARDVGTKYGDSHTATL